MNHLIKWAAGIAAMAIAGCNAPASPPQSAVDLSAGASVAGEIDYVADRFLVRESALDHASTLANLLTALDRRDLTVFAVIDHAAGAQNVGLSLSPSTLVIFGSPRSGTPLMQAEPLMGMELPLKALVYDLAGQTYLAVSGMGYLERSYPLSTRAELIDNIREALDGISNEATSL